MTKFRKTLFPSIIAAFIIAAFNAVALTITPTFDSSITSDPNSAAIQSAINAAIQVYQTNFSDSVTVKILFRQMNSGLGQSSTYYNDVSYSAFLNVLQTRSRTTNDVAALAHLPTGANNPVNNHTMIRSTMAHLRAMGFSGMNLPAGYYDSTISINFSLCNLDRATVNPGRYDVLAVAMHEMNEVLGTGSALASEAESRVPDLFRYSSMGTRSFTSSGDDAYFSLDGMNRLVRYNQNSGGDFGDWWSIGSHTPRVQDAFGTAGVVLNQGVELIVLDAIGWNWIGGSGSTSVVNPTFAIQAIKRIGNRLDITWNAVSGQTYQLQYTTNLFRPVWNNLGSPVSASSASATASDTIGADPQRFYRVQNTSVGVSSGAEVVSGFVDVKMLKAQTREFRQEEKKEKKK